MPAKNHRKATSNPKPNNKKTVGPPIPPPHWPLLQPVIPPSDLQLETLLEDQIVLIRNLFTPTLCKKYVSFLSSLPLTTTPVKPREGEALRVNDRVQFDDFSFAEQLWTSTALQSLVTGLNSEGSPSLETSTAEERKKLWGGEVCGLNPRIRIYRYTPGQFFGQHYDESTPLLLPTTPPTPAKTVWTLLIYLTGPSTGCVGGETVFYPELGPAKKYIGKSSEVDNEPVAVGLEEGMALLHKHGPDCLLHEGRKVVEGEKWVIRSDLCVRR